MILYDIMADIRKELAGLSRRQIQELLRKILPEARTTLSTFVSNLADPRRAMTYRYESEGSNVDPYYKTMPDTVRTWMFDVRSCMDGIQPTWWLITFDRLCVETRSWRNVAQKARLRQDQAKAIVERCAFSLVYEMRDRGIPTTPHR